MIRNGLKRTISANGGFGLLQIVSELDTGWCASENASPKGMNCENSHQLDRGTKHFLKGCGNLSLLDVL